MSGRCSPDLHGTCELLQTCLLRRWQSTWRGDAAVHQSRVDVGAREERRRREEEERKPREEEDCTKREEAERRQAEEEEEKRKKLEKKREKDSERSKGDRRRSKRGWSKNIRQRRKGPRE
jgi:hypothetical protein